MHVVFFNRSFYPDTSATGQLLTDLAEDLVALHGCQVTVVTGVPLLPGGAARAGAVPRRETYRGVQIVRTLGTTFSKRRFAGRAINYVTYFLSACWAGLRVRRPDIVVALTDPPIIGLAGWLTARRARAPLVMAYNDLFPEVAALLPDFHSETVNRGLQAVNVFLCRAATRIVALGETMRQRLITNKGAAPEKTVVIPSWADTSAITPGSKHNAFAETHGLSDRFVVMHSGNLGLSQGLEHLVDAARRLRDVPEIQVVFQGEGVKRAELQARAERLALANVTFLPFAPKERLGESFAAADLFVVSLQQGLAGYIVPSKLYGILAAGRPYVAAVEDDCEVAVITREWECGIVVPPGDAPALADRVLELFHDRATLERLGTNARAAAMRFDRRVQISNYMRLFESIAQRGPSAARVPVEEPNS
jgi:glycosyltransferase involved in cell wall biosynthesis